MGVGNHVVGAEHKQYEQKYDFYSKEGIERLLRDTHKLHIRAFERGDMAAVDIMLDMELAIERAGLTDKQRQAIELLFEKDLKLKDAAALQGIEHSTLSRNKSSAITKLSNVYREWEYLE